MHVELRGPRAGRLLSMAEDRAQGRSLRRRDPSSESRVVRKFRSGVAHHTDDPRHAARERHRGVRRWQSSFLRRHRGISAVLAVSALYMFVVSAIRAGIWFSRGNALQSMLSTALVALATGTILVLLQLYAGTDGTA